MPAISERIKPNQVASATNLLPSILMTYKGRFRIFGLDSMWVMPDNRIIKGVIRTIKAYRKTKLIPPISALKKVVITSSSFLLLLLQFFSSGHLRTKRANYITMLKITSSQKSCQSYLFTLSTLPLEQMHKFISELKYIT